LRDALYLSCKRQAWLDLPQMMRLTITTCNVLEMLEGCEIACPYNFLLLPMIDPVLGFPFPKQNGNALPIAVCNMLLAITPQNFSNTASASA
jgi:hypothetical protein